MRELKKKRDNKWSIGKKSPDIAANQVAL